MRLTFSDYSDPQIDPNDPFVPQAIVGDETLETAISDPAVFAASSSLPADALRRHTTEVAMRDVLRQQQLIVYDMGRTIGVLQPFVRSVIPSLRFVDLSLESLTPKSIARHAVQTWIGAAADVLSAVPNLYVQIAAAALDLSLTLVSWAQWIGKIDQPQARLVTPEMPVQEYSDETDAYLFNNDVRLTMQTTYDWTRLFMPRYRGELTGKTFKNRIQQRSIGWALGTGEIPRVHYPGSGRNKWKEWSYTDATTEGGGYLNSGGLGMIPGGQRIYGIVQTTAIEVPYGPRRGHPTVYDPRCDGYHGVSRTDIGSYYPTTTQGALSIWDFCFKIGPAMYTIDALGLAVGRNDSYSYEVFGWRDYLDAIWNGVIELWRNETYEGGWGCSFWKAALQALVQNYTVSQFGIGTLSWTPSTNDALTLKDQDNWEDSNVFERVIKESLWQLTSAQLLYLGKSNIAAYLPIKGGVDADPLKQETVMGSMRDHVLRRQFYQARRRILDGPGKYNVVLKDVLDPVFRNQIKDAGGGKQADRDPEILQLALPEGVAVPQGGTGLPLGSRVTPGRSLWPYFAAGGLAVAATGIGYYFWDEIADAVRAGRQHLPRRLR